MHINMVGEGTEACVLDRIRQGGGVVDHVNVGGVVVVNLVFELLHVVDGHDVDAGSGGQVIDWSQAFRREVGSVVLVDLVAKDANVLAALFGQVGKVENADASRIVRGDVVVDVHVLRVFDFIAVNVVLGAVAAHDHVVGLSDVKARVRCAPGNRI